MAGSLYRLEAPIRRYDWGSPTALPALLGADNPNREPWAEMWLGTHPAAPSQVYTPAGTVPLAELLAGADADQVGGRANARLGHELPFLLKLIAAEKPLSIQCHPDRDQARAGFRREEAAGVPRDAPERCYRDARHKPELVVALSPFAALAGFRTPPDIVAAFEDMNVDELQPEVSALAKTGEVSAFFSALLRIEERRSRAILDQVARGAARSASQDASLVADLLARHPRDLGALAPLYLNFVELSAGDGLFLPPRQLHSYLRGTAVEVMASSDNVLRGGLTTKPVATAELDAVVDPAPAPPRIVRAQPTGPGVSVYPTPAEEFELARVSARGGRDCVLSGLSSASLAICAEGQVTIRDPDGGESLSLSGGRAALIAASVPRVHIEGSGVVYAAYVPKDA